VEVWVDGVDWNDLAVKADKLMKRKLALEARWDQNAKHLWDSAVSAGGINGLSYRAKILEWAGEARPNLWVTVSYRNVRTGGATDYMYVHGRLDRLLNRICQKAYGKNSMSNGRSRPPVFGFLEHPRTNKHFNLIMRADKKIENAILVHGERIWRKVIRSAGFHLTRIHSPERVLKYCTKEQRLLGDFSSAYFYGNSID
jgi:hypothetical protein